MHKNLAFLLILIISASCVSNKTTPAEDDTSSELELNNITDSVSYAIGISIGNNLKNQSLGDINLDIMKQSMQSAIQGDSSLKMEMGEANNLIRNYIRDMQVKEGADFLKENSKRDGVVTLPSGLQYEILVEGNGPIPTATDKVKTHYHGTLIDGTVFDSSVERGQPATFGVNQVIQGWVEALQLMPVGSKWKLFIPYDLAYGERGSPPKIAPYSALIFEVELISIEN